jgi:hypothetical protein
MPTAKPRITITLEPRTHEVLARLSAAGGDSMSALVTQFVDLAVPSMERLVVVLERARAAPEETRAGLAAAIDRAERNLMPALQAAVDQRDLFLADLESKTGREAAAAGAPAQRGRRASRAGGGKGSTPVPVTRGSGRHTGGSAGRVNPKAGTRKGGGHGAL